jgi:IclR family acetate operon transcriptional repressor
MDFGPSLVHAGLSVAIARGADVESMDSVRSVERAIDLLVVLETATQPMRLSDIARLAGIHKATAQRLLLVLERRGFIQREQDRYLIGVAALPLAHGFIISDRLSEKALAFQQRLAAVSQETTSLFVRLGLQRVLVQRVEAALPLQYSLPIGQRLPLHLGVGKVLAAYLPQQDLNRLLEPITEIRYASGEVRTPAQFVAELEHIRREQVAVAISERMLGTVSVAAPVITGGGRTIAALSIAWPIERHSQKRVTQLATEVRRAAQALAERLV